MTEGPNELTLPSRHPFRVAVLLAVTALVVFVGWRVFWFLTDDAHIAFRYASSAMEGHGFVWNPPPFLPVEGYTSFLWVALLTGVWKATGIAPPESSNVLSLIFGYATLFVGYRFVLRLRLPPRLERHRYAFLALVLLGTATNRTFLTWLSSGLETSLFNFCFTWWVFEALTPCTARAPSWGYRLSTSAALAALTRPDGLLIVAGSAAILVWDLVQRGSIPQRWRRAALSAAPLLAIPAHVAWRRATYGEWLPNTYYAKLVDAWPESGIRYAASFAVEYGLWVWLILAAVTVWFLARRYESLPRWQSSLHVVIALGVVGGQVAYYTFVVGGDHFEYRVYSHLVLLSFVSAVWMVARLDLRPRVAFLVLGSLLLASHPVAWVHWAETRHLSTRDETFRLAPPIAERFPPPFRPVVEVWDGWQRWLVDRSVGMRHQEHKIYYLSLVEALPAREAHKGFERHDRVVLSVASVGVVGWVYPEAAVIDLQGLNDWVIARNPNLREARDNQLRQMAHDRRPPRGYVYCFHPVGVQTLSGAILLEPREDWDVLDDAGIQRCEARGRRWVRWRLDPSRLPAGPPPPARSESRMEQGEEDVR